MSSPATSLHCPECHHALTALRSHGHCPWCLFPLSAHYLGIVDGDTWLGFPASEEQRGELLRNPSVRLVYSLPWDHDLIPFSPA